MYKNLYRLKIAHKIIPTVKLLWYKIYFYPSILIWKVAFIILIFYFSSAKTVKRFSSYELDVVSKKSRLESTSAITVDTRWDYSVTFRGEERFQSGLQVKNVLSGAASRPLPRVL